ncbi:hypothetical protein KIF53_15195 [Chromobacterium subtsugae]|uniref:ASP external chaperone domain-containing protein n=1 Tax=Chromobacterium subtsugae TaxID=251747 RepID=A0ABS7FFX3_9NEIS|nr:MULTISPECIES: hypothetical protein [Chromobacterium]KUM02805.1 hypothetical protein Cv017_01770 [Chromobacterium subtsugae]KZE85021.1 hypothetical protein AWB61_03315 [Chromobacterium sp. F49]MBW7567751.1 hypothetical protein [Chromobacterium subtsugae]MBW8288977.1 hypothetical protein [Chromobacterium subtsugae]OBU85511.1 hypothetical protein MY55_16195 [Chromobacterium subtsugae]
MKKTILTLSLLALAGGALAADLPFLPKPAGQAVTINGKTYYKQASQAKAAAKSASGASFRASGAPALNRGDVVQSPKQALPATVSGTVLVQLASAQDEAAVARDHGLSVRFRTQSVVVYEAPAQTELLGLQQRLAADKRVKKAQLELASNDNLPQ